MKTEMHAVIGQAAGYTDDFEWIVACYVDAEQAQLHRDAAQERVNELEDLEYDDREKLAELSEKEKKPVNSFDPEFNPVWLDSVIYSVSTFPFFSHFDEFQDQRTEHLDLAVLDQEEED